MSEYRTATPAEIRRDADRARRAKLAQENHTKLPRTLGGRIRDAIEHAKNSTKKSQGADPGLIRICSKDENERQDFNPPDA